MRTDHLALLYLWALDSKIRQDTFLSLDADQVFRATARLLDEETLRIVRGKIMTWLASSGQPETYKTSWRSLLRDLG